MEEILEEKVQECFHILRKLSIPKRLEYFISNCYELDTQEEETKIKKTEVVDILRDVMDQENLESHEESKIKLISDLII